MEAASSIQGPEVPSCLSVCRPAACTSPTRPPARYACSCCSTRPRRRSSWAASPVTRVASSEPYGRSSPPASRCVGCRGLPRTHWGSTVWAGAGSVSLGGGQPAAPHLCIPGSVSSVPGLPALRAGVGCMHMRQRPASGQGPSRHQPICRSSHRQWDLVVSTQALQVINNKFLAWSGIMEW